MSKSREELRTIVERLNPQAKCLLKRMKAGASYLSSQLQKLLGEGTKAKAVGAVGWLLANGLARETSGGTSESYVSLADKGQDFQKSGGLPEGKIVELLKEENALSIKVLGEGLSLPKEELNPILGRMKKEGVISFESGGLVVPGDESAVKKAEERYKKVNSLLKIVSSKEKVNLQALSDEQQQIIEEMSRKRGKGKAVFRLAREVEMAYELTPAGEEARGILAGEGEGSPPEIYDDTSVGTLGVITPEILKKESWRGQTFRKYDITTPPPKSAYGRKHPYGLFLDSVRKKLVAMGFEEMRGRMVETEFWNNDALFMPQDHPARAIHDVYFVKDPKYSNDLPEDLVEKVAMTHEDGWKTGSLGWRYKFERKQTSRFVLRSQGTAVSARMLAAGPKIPGKYFAIARCFRYDRVDATHASDFNQIEGIVLSRQMNFRRLLGLLKLFALEIAGSSEVRFVPSYFPFTEPSVEVQFKHKKLGWMELGGAGIFRKEVTLPFGIDVPVIAWGLGLDRMAMVALSLNDIRDLFTSDLGKVRKMKFKQT